MPDEADDPLPATPPGQRYANHLEVAFGLSQVELCFSQVFDADDRKTLSCLIQTTPVHLVSFGHVISRTIASYEDRFGRIPNAIPQGGR
jgi:hypothetical protein